MKTIKINGIFLNENNISGIEPFFRKEVQEIDGEKANVTIHGIRLSGNIEPKHYEHLFENKKLRDAWIEDFENSQTVQSEELAAVLNPFISAIKSAAAVREPKAAAAAKEPKAAAAAKKPKAKKPE